MMGAVDVWAQIPTERMAQCSCFHVDTSAYALHRLPAAFIAWMKGLGQNRVMFGTDWPMLSPQKCLEGLGGLELSEKQADQFLSGNARRVFSL
jgi:predicted TIM-barrel fold metal-dependent hydrolase